MPAGGINIYILYMYIRVYKYYICTYMYAIDGGTSLFNALPAPET